MTCLVIHTPPIQDLDALIQVPVLSLHWSFQFSGEYECNCYINQCNARTKAMQCWNATNELKCNRGFRLNYKKNPAKNNRQWFHSNEAQSNTCNTEKSTMTRLANKISGFDGYFATLNTIVLQLPRRALGRKVPTKWRGTDPGRNAQLQLQNGANLLKLFYSSISSWNGVTSPHCAAAK